LKEIKKKKRNKKAVHFRKKKEAILLSPYIERERERELKKWTMPYKSFDPLH